MKFKDHNPPFPGTVRIQNATVITPDRVLPNALVEIENGRFRAIVPADEGGQWATEVDYCLDANGAYLMPGIIDLHSDKLESEITPRPGADLPIDLALQEIEQKFLACGITTLFHAISLGYLVSEKAKSSHFTRAQMCYATHEFAQTRAIARTYVHLRYEIQGHDLDKVYQAIDDGIVDLLSVMDHRPGHGQMSKERFMKNALKRGLPQEVAESNYEEHHNREILSEAEIRKLVDYAHLRDLYVASHDDPSPEKVEIMREMGINIAEFPLTLEAAEKAIALGMKTIGGSANSLRGGSLSGNLCVNTALDKKLISAMCSDYYPPALVHSVFKLAMEDKMTLPEAVQLITLGAARIVGLDEHLGSIEIGKHADFLLVDDSSGRPKVLQTWVGGRAVHQSSQRSNNPASPFPLLTPLTQNA